MAQGGTGSETIVRVLLPNGVKAGTHRLLLPQDFFSVPGKPLVDALENNQGRRNYASRFISLMCEKEPELKIARNWYSSSTVF